MDAKLSSSKMMSAASLAICVPICPSKPPDVGSFEGRRIGGPVAGHGDDLAWSGPSRRSAPMPAVDGDGLSISLSRVDWNRARSRVWRGGILEQQQRLVQPVRECVLVVGSHRAMTLSLGQMQVERSLDKHPVGVVDPLPEFFARHGPVFQQVRDVRRHPTMFIVLLPQDAAS